MRNKNEIFDDIDDKTVEMFSEEYPVLTDEEKERIFTMSERKYNITNNGGADNGDEVSGVDTYSRPIWKKYAAAAAAFVLLAGGIGGSLILGRRMKDTSPEKDHLADTTTSVTTDAVTTAETTGIYTTTEADAIVTTATTSIDVETTTVQTTAQANNSSKDPDVDAVAERMVNKFIGAEKNLFFHLIDVGLNPAVQFDAYSEKYGEMALTYFKVEDERFKTPEGISEVIHSVYTPEYADNLFNDCYGGDMTDKINSGTPSYDDFKEFIIYNGEMYVEVVGMDDGTSAPIEITGEKISDTEMLAHWSYTLFGDTEQLYRTLYLVWVDEYNDWRVADSTYSYNYFRKLTDEEAITAGNELMNGFADVFNAYIGADVQVDEKDCIAFDVKNNNGDYEGDSGGYWVLNYYRVTDSRFSTTDELKSYLFTKYEDWMAEGIIGDLSNFSNGDLIPDLVDTEKNLVVSDVARRYVNYNGKLYLCRDAGVYWLRGGVKMEKDPQITSADVESGTFAKLNVDDYTNTIMNENDYANTDRGFFAVERNEDGKWRVNGYYPGD